MTVFRQPDSTRPPEGLSEGHENESPARDPRHAQSTGATTPPKWAARAREKDLLILRAVAELPTWWAEKVLARTEVDAGCRAWLGHRGSNGYGQVCLPAALGVRFSNGNAPIVGVHRAALVIDQGHPLSLGMVTDHLCRVRACCEPSHLVEVTNRENLLAEGSQSPTALLASRTHCPRGHQLAGDNLVPSEVRRGRRACQTCDLEKGARRSAKVSEVQTGLGISQVELRETFGRSDRVMTAILDRLAEGTPPWVILDGARAAKAAAEVDLGDWLESLHRGRGAAS